RFGDPSLRAPNSEHYHQTPLFSCALTYASPATHAPSLLMTRSFAVHHFLLGSCLLTIPHRFQIRRPDAIGMPDLDCTQRALPTPAAHRRIADLQVSRHLLHGQHLIHKPCDSTSCACSSTYRGSQHTMTDSCR